MLTLVCAAVVLRIIGGLLKNDQPRSIVAVLGATTCTAAAWAAASAVGALCPLWVALALGIGCELALPRRQHRLLYLGIDVVAVLLIGFSSIVPPTNASLLIAVAVGFATLGYGADQIAEFAKPRAVRYTGIVFGILFITAMSTGLLLIVKAAGQSLALFREDPLVWIYGVAMPEVAGRRIELDNRAIAWCLVADADADADDRVGAVVFHGNYRDGSMHHTAYVLSSLLEKAGFVVLSVDHPGFGASPLPANVSDVKAWDPMDAGVAAFEHLRREMNVQNVMLVGHSMGCTDVLRLLASETDCDRAVLFGTAGDAGIYGALGDERDRRSKFRYRQFRTVRLLEEPLPFDRWEQITDRFYSNDRFALALRSHHIPVTFVRFGVESKDIVQHRDDLYELLPGAKEVWDLPRSTHAFNSYSVGEVILSDARVCRCLWRKFGELRESMLADARRDHQ